MFSSPMTRTTGKCMQVHSFKHGYQNATTFFNLGGTDVNIYGDGKLDGNDQVWHDLYAQNDLILIPIISCWQLRCCHGGSTCQHHS